MPNMETSTLLPGFAALIPFIVEYVKNSPQVQGITPETKGRLITLAAALSSLAGVISGVADGSIDGNLVSVFFDSAWQASVAFGLTQGAYNMMKWAGIFKQP